MKNFVNKAFTCLLLLLVFMQVAAAAPGDIRAVRGIFTYIEASGTLAISATGLTANTISTTGNNGVISGTFVFANRVSATNLTVGNISATQNATIANATITSLTVGSISGTGIGGQPHVAVLTTSQTWITPDGTSVATVFKITACGGGGGGGGGGSGSQCAGGGGAGVCSEYYGTGVLSGSNVTVTVGRAGIARCNNDQGEDGVSSTVVFNGTTLTAGGGQGGFSSYTGNPNPQVGGRGGMSANGILATRGTNGGSGNADYSGKGGECSYGGGGREQPWSNIFGATGEAATGFCSGGSGGCQGNNNCGGKGSNGFVTIEWLQ